MARSREDDQRILEEIGDDAYLRGAVKSALHVRRYLPFYVFTAVWALMLALVPTIRGGGGEEDLAVEGSPQQPGTTADVQGNVATAGDPAATATDGTTATAPDQAAATRQPSGQAAGRPAPAKKGTPVAAAGNDAARRVEGKARSGVECKEGVRQIPGSSYATQCTVRFEGDNGGETFRGVTADKIRIVRREFPDNANSQAVAEVSREAGFADEETAKKVRDVFIKYFNENYELYGRQVEWVDYESENGNSTEEAQGRGREGACADATQIEKSLKTFAVDGGSAPFSECAAERKIPVFGAAAYYPESFYRKYHPYLWGTPTECERISYQVAEYVGKRLNGKKARWAGDPLLKEQTRKFGTYVPDNDGYQQCVRISEEEGEKKYGTPKPERYNYQLDVSRFPDQAAQAIVQFKSAGVTTIVNACDPISTIFLTQAASRQNYRPEWYIIGVALQDTDNLARLYDQQQVDGHLFGMSQLGATTKLIGPDSEPGRIYKKITGQEIPPGTDGSYFTLVKIYNLLQAAGPNLTPDAIGASAKSIPPGGAPDYPAGYWSFQDGPNGKAGAGDHTLIDDSREIFWDGQQNGPDGKKGTYIETYNGKRFRNGEWPQEEPPIYPGR